MTWLWQLRSLYSLDVLDTRFTNSSSIPPKSDEYEQRIDPARRASTSALDKQGNNVEGATKKSLWHTQEFYIYYVIFLIAIPLMFKAAIDVSKGSLWKPSLKYCVLTLMKKRIPAIRNMRRYSHRDGFLDEK